MPETQEKSMGLLEQGELEVDSDSTLNEDDRPPTPVAKTRAQLMQVAEIIGGLIVSRASVLRPAFLTRQTKPVKLRRTAYLDGIRGFAALLVYCLHHQLWAHAMQGGTTKLENTFGWDGQYYFGAFPFVRTFFTGGHYAVATFFVLSGYVIALKPLTLINNGELLALSDSMASGLFRRWLRLYIPIIVVTLFWISLPHTLGLSSDWVPQSNFKDELWKWYCDLKNFTFIWNLGGDPLLDQHKHVWSIPVEMRGSITIFTAALAFSRCTRTARLWCEILLVYYFMYIVDGSHYAMFTAGMVLCDLDLAAMDGVLPGWMYRLKPFKTPIFYVLFIISVLLGGVPSNSVDLQHMKDSPGWYYLAFLKPQAVFDYRWFFLFWAAVLLVASTPHISWVKGFFESRFCQYLGRICYMFYLMHGPCLWIIGDRLYAAVGWVNFMHAMTIPGWADSFPLPKWGPFGLEFSFIVVQIIMLPLTLWVAEVTTALIDNPSIKFAQWCYTITLPAKAPKQISDPQRKA